MVVGLLGLLTLVWATHGDANTPVDPIGHERILSLARASNGQLTEDAFARTFVGMDPGMSDLARRFAPAPKPTLIGLVGAGTGSTDEPLVKAQTLQGLSWDTARLVNASIPYSVDPNPPARPFKLEASPADRDRAIQCLTEAVYYEAAFEPAEGRRAVAQVVINRLRHAIYPKTICGVVYQGADLQTGCQFTFTCDGALHRPPVEWAWKEAHDIAQQALDGYVAKAVGNATHYHADYVVPYWLPTLTKVAKMGSQIFYRWSGSMGMPPAFSGRYAGNEPARSPATVGGARTELAKAVVAPPAELVTSAPVIQLAAAPSIPAQAMIVQAPPPSLKVDIDRPVFAAPQQRAWVPPSPLSGGGGGGAFGGGVRAY